MTGHGIQQMEEYLERGENCTTELTEFKLNVHSTAADEPAALQEHIPPAEPLPFDVEANSSWPPFRLYIRPIPELTPTERPSLPSHTKSPVEYPVIGATPHADLDSRSAPFDSSYQNSPTILVSSSGPNRQEEASTQAPVDDSSLSGQSFSDLPSAQKLSTNLGHSQLTRSTCIPAASTNQDCRGDHVEASPAPIQEEERAPGDPSAADCSSGDLKSLRRQACRPRLILKHHLPPITKAVQQELNSAKRVLTTVNSLLVVAAFISGVQAQIIAISYKDNPGGLSIRLLKLFSFLGLYFDVIGTCWGVLHTLTVQRTAQKCETLLADIQTAKSDVQLVLQSRGPEDHATPAGRQRWTMN
ncbi:hypothetical protein JAAARDRAFT_46592 [Jaapia argillacea MUCL 33604]|uniref:Uncharacterized protein n=1 Tax=Jaapia argillacea MUCL 33604 TaxID=933084 RepID=A0A067PYL8_9AGAM|nr:hypothetical protein JAAARDRAFT_46592 [Jaapia argillacea MUCL 33604]